MRSAPDRTPAAGCPAGPPPVRSVQNHPAKRAKNAPFRTFLNGFRGIGGRGGPDPSTRRDRRPLPAPARPPPDRRPRDPRPDPRAPTQAPRPRRAPCPHSGPGSRPSNVREDRRWRRSGTPPWSRVSGKKRSRRHRPAPKRHRPRPGTGPPLPRHPGLPRPRAGERPGRY